jgi:D-glucosaminate-6-phosphate ammonia-lyase
LERDLPTIINAAGTLTRLSAGPLAPGVLQAMAAADETSLDMAALQAHASRCIADATGAEAGLVTSGAAAGLLLAAAAVIARLDVRTMNSLPFTGGPDEIIVARGHRNGYDHALRTAGAKLIEVGLPEPMSGAGIRDAEPWEYEAAIGPRTAAIFYVACRHARPNLSDVVAVGRAHHLPVIVDAAAELPPAANLRRFIEEGADLVVFSGGKALRGPAGTGLLCGKTDLIMSAALQSLDMDIQFSQWQPPADFIDSTRLQGLPRQGIGRSCKVGKHDVLGLLAALDHFVSEGDAVRHARWRSLCNRIFERLDGAVLFDITVTGSSDFELVPMVKFRFQDEEQARQYQQRLLKLPSAIHIGCDGFDPTVLFVNPTCLREREISPLIEGLKS